MDRRVLPPDKIEAAKKFASDLVVQITILYQKVDAWIDTNENEVDLLNSYVLYIPICQTNDNDNGFEDW